jgi:hypothetical protein
MHIGSAQCMYTQKSFSTSLSEEDHIAHITYLPIRRTTSLRIQMVLLMNHGEISSENSSHVITFSVTCINENLLLFKISK